MASKGQKFSTYTEELKKEILEKYLNGISSRNLAKQYNIPAGTIRMWKRKMIDHPELYLNQGLKKGPKNESNLTKEDWKERYEILKKYQAFLKAQRERK